MRITAQVFLAYGLLLVVATVWRLLPLGQVAPDLIALSAVYIGLTTRDRVAPAVFGAVVIGYLGDLLLGAPRGLMAATAGLVCLLGHFVQGRLIVRGRLVALVFAGLVGMTSGAIVLIVRAVVGLEAGRFASELTALVRTGVMTGLAGPLFFYLARHVDARFARTRRERDAALDGLIG